MCRKIEDTPERVIERVTDGSKWINDPGTGCYVWTSSLTSSGYAKIGYGENGKVYEVKAHRIACFAAHGAPPEGKTCVMHSCDNPMCVRPEHLSWCTRTENNADKVSKGRQSKGEKHGRAKVTDAIALDICARYDAGETQTAIARSYGIAQSQVSFIVNGKTWSHVTGRIHPSKKAS